MIIIDKRIDVKYCIEVELEEQKSEINSEIIEYWLSPFFSVQNENTCKLNVGSIIKVIAGISQHYMYHDHIFYVNAELSSNKILYILMSIIRMFYKYVSFLIGYQNLHGACLKYKDNGILIIAERNQGKTTMLLNAIQDTDYLLLANDQVMYSGKDNQLLGYPAAVGIRNNSCCPKKQRQVNEMALWFVEDSFQINPKPVIHIKDLARIFQCNIADRARLNLLVTYEKSTQKNELIITNTESSAFSLNDITLPFENTYKEGLLKSCKHSINHYMRREFDVNGSATIDNDIDISIRKIHVKCGIDRMRDMLCEIKSLLK